MPLVGEGNREWTEGQQCQGLGLLPRTFLRSSPREAPWDLGEPLPRLLGRSRSECTRIGYHGCCDPIGTNALVPTTTCGVTSAQPGPFPRATTSHAPWNGVERPGPTPEGRLVLTGSPRTWPTASVPTVGSDPRALLDAGQCQLQGGLWEPTCDSDI